MIVISARSLGEDKVRALDLVDDYVTKPFWTNELTARIRAVVRRLGGGRDNVKDTAFGSVSVDMVARQVAIAGKPIALTPTEFELLRFFIERQNKHSAVNESSIPVSNQIPRLKRYRRIFLDYGRARQRRFAYRDCLGNWLSLQHGLRHLAGRVYQTAYKQAGAIVIDASPIGC